MVATTPGSDVVTEPVASVAPASEKSALPVRPSVTLPSVRPAGGGSSRSRYVHVTVSRAASVIVASAAAVVIPL